MHNAVAATVQGYAIRGPTADAHHVLPHQQELPPPTAPPAAETRAQSLLRQFAGLSPAERAVVWKEICRRQEAARQERLREALSRLALDEPLP